MKTKSVGTVMSNEEKFSSGFSRVRQYILQTCILEKSDSSPSRYTACSKAFRDFSQLLRPNIRIVS